MNKKPTHHKLLDFPLMLGGPLYQLYLKTFLVEPPLNLVKRRIIAITLFAWLPLLLLSLFSGTAYEGVKVPFLFDVDTHARFLIALGLLIGTEVIAHKHIQVIVNQFTERDIITLEIRPQFKTIVDSALKWRNSIMAEILIIVFVYTVGHLSWTYNAALDVTTWYMSTTEGHSKFTLVGYWYSYVSIPIFQFILCRWYYRIFIWYRFLWKVSRLRLHLNSLHPDRAGGLGFLNKSVEAMMAGLLAHTVLLAGLIANRIWHAGQTLQNFKLEIAGMLVFLIVIALLPLLFFIIALLKTKRKGLVEFGLVACGYVNDFRSKWIGHEQSHHEKILGSSDIQSLADLSNSFNIVNEMRLVPFDKFTILQLGILTVLPLLPLFLTIIPLTVIIDKLIRILL